MLRGKKAMPPVEYPFKQALQQHKDRSDTLFNYQIKLFDSASAYTKLVLGIGYGGFFTAWSMSRALLTRKELLWSALGISISLSAFVIFEVLQMILMNVLEMQSLDRLVKADIESFDRIAREVELKKNQRRRWLMPAWYATLTICLCCGLGAAGILIYAFIHSLIKA
jgi:hypothetical protein